MPSYKTVVEGQNFVFDVDNEPQNINFYKTLYVNALNEAEAEDLALDKIKHVLDDSGIEFNLSTGYETLLIDDIEQINVLDDNVHVDRDIVWFFSDEEFL
jgi:hypothetical protein